MSLNPHAQHWSISSGRNPDGSRSYTSGSFGPFCREDDETWWNPRAEPSLGWAPTVEEAWERWERQMFAWRDQAEAQARRLEAAVENARRARGLL